jgi:hypothetical protein
MWRGTYAIFPRNTVDFSKKLEKSKNIRKKTKKIFHKSEKY